LARYLVPVVCICVGIALLAFAAWRFATITVGTTATTERAISDILNMADRGQLKSVSISGNDVVATGTRNQKFHAVKEDGEAVTEIFRKDGVQVNIDNGQRGQWTQ